MSSVDSKVLHIYKLLEKLYQKEELYAQKKSTLDELGVCSQTLGRYLNTIQKLFGSILISEKRQISHTGRKTTVLRIPDPKKDAPKVVKFFFETQNDLSWLLTLIYENDPTLLQQIEEKEIKQAIETIINTDKNTFLFCSNPFENLQNSSIIRHFNALKKAVREHEYRTIKYSYNTKEIIEDAKCLKLIFLENNWYLAIETKDENLRLLRVSFIQEVHYSKKISYQLQVLNKYENYFKTIQNPFTLHNTTEQTALLKASPKVAKYFQPHMKAFFSSQKFIKSFDDGSVLFSIRYTQHMEILPFVKKWLPDITILEPLELKEAFKKDLLLALSHIDK
jgi:predicted DNA-binding transcriptional regulator YafY